MSPAKLMLSMLVRTLLCLLVSAACYFMFTALLGATGQASETRVIWAMTILTSSVVWVFAFLRPAFALTGLLAEADVLKVLGPKALGHLNWQKMPADEYAEISAPNLKGFFEKGIEKLFAGKLDVLSRRFRK